MLLRKKTVEVITHEEMIEQASKLHASLVHFEVKAHETPAAIFRLRHLYREIIRHDQLHFKAEKLTAQTESCNASIKMADLLYKFIHVSLAPEDIDALHALEYPEADHMRAYLSFEREALEYARRIRHFLHEHKREISVKVIDDKGVRKKLIPEFYKYGEPSNAVMRVQKILKNIEHEHVPLNLMKIFNKVFDIYTSVKPSKTRPVKTAEFYAQQLEKLDKFTFVPLVPVKKVKKKVVRRRKRRHHAQPSGVCL